MDAIWAAASVGGRDFIKSMPVYARIGSNRALINANVPFEYVTAKNLWAGLANRYQVIYLPACLALDENLLDLFKQYVEDGGRLVLDAPGGWYDYYGQLLSTKQGSPFEQLFGTHIANLQYSSESQRKR